MSSSARFQEDRTQLPVIPCGVGLIRDGRRFLIAQRNSGDTFGSFWEFPGGKRENGETFEDCVVREVLEELGVRVAVESKFMEIRREHNQKIIWLNFYLCAYLSGEPKPLDCQKVLWVDVAELERYHFPPANERIIAELVARYGAL